MCTDKRKGGFAETGCKPPEQEEHMKRKDLKGTWQKAAEQFEACWAPDILGWWYSRHCLGEKLDLQMVLQDAKEECPIISAIELEPHFEVLLETDDGKLRIRYRSKGIQIGHSYFLEKKAG